MAAFPAVVALLLLGASAAIDCTPDTLLAEQRVFGTFQRATRLAVNPQGWIYVLDADRNAVILFRDFHSDPTIVGGYGWTATTFDRPTGLATDGLNVYISDYGNHRIQRFDRFLNHVSSFATRDTDYVPARFGYPDGVALSRLGDLFILDSDNLRAAKYTGTGKFERSFGGIDDRRGKLEHPVKILAARNDHVYVLEAHRLLEFDYFGSYIRAMGDAVLRNARGFDVDGGRAVVATTDTLYWFSDRGDVSHATAFGSLLTSVPIENVMDVALDRDLLYVLTDQKVFVLKIRPVD